MINYTKLFFQYLYKSFSFNIYLKKAIFEYFTSNYDKEIQQFTLQLDFAIFTRFFSNRIEFIMNFLIVNKVLI